ncbi:MAG TPA: CbtB-domain containing protein [Pseudonocardiaceae bacterium]|nr:CbtB-domain containing protein [Pseudonocardiaceae bacterium]
MASPAVSPYRPARGAVVPWWAFVVAVVGLGLVFLALQENGALLAAQAQVLHEFFHDGRHALGVPCH